MFTVTILEKGGSERRLTFDKDEVSIGRISGNDIILPKGNISKRHSRIVVKDQKFIVIDLKSTNGTYVNKERISAPRVIGDSDKVYIGDFIMRLSHGSADEADAPAAPAPAARPAPEPTEIPAATEHQPPAQHPGAMADDIGELVSEDGIEFGEPAPAAAPAPAAPAAAPVPERAPAPPPAAPPKSTVAEQEAALMHQETLAPEDEPPAPATVAVPVPAAAPPEPEITPDDEPSLVEMELEDPADEIDDDRFDIYVAVLELLQLKVTESVFADVDPDDIDLDDAQWARLEQDVTAVVDAARSEGVVPDFLDTADLTQQLLYEFTGLGPIEYFLTDDAVSAIQINDFNQIFVTRAGETEMVWKSFSSPAALDACVDKFCASLGFRPDDRPPVMSGELPEGTRFQVLLPPIVPSGAVITLQKPNSQSHTMQSLIEQGGLTEPMASYLFEKVQAGANIVVCGAGGTAPSTVVNALGYFIPEHQRIAVVENRPEISLPHANVIRLRLPALPDERRALFAILPTLLADRVLVSETAGDSATALLELALSGVDGLVSVMYARSSDDLIARLRTLIQLGGASASGADSLVAMALDLVIHVEATDSGVRIASIDEVAANKGAATLVKQFEFVPNKKGGGSFRQA